MSEYEHAASTKPTPTSAARRTPGIRQLLKGLPSYSGTWATPDAVDLPFSKAGLAAVGAAPGGGLIVVLPADVCGLVEAARG